MAAFREPWQDGAKAYPEADSLAAILPGIKRKRKPLTVLIRHSTGALDGVPCDACGEDLAAPYSANALGRTDAYAMVDVDPRSKTYVARHYYCAWNTVLARLYEMRHLLGD